MHPQSHPVAIIQVPECIIGIDRMSWPDSHIGSLTLGVTATAVGEANWELLELPLPGQIVNQKQCSIPGGTAETSVTVKDLKDAGMVILTTSPFHSPSWSMKRTNGSWRMTVDN